MAKQEKKPLELLNEKFKLFMSHFDTIIQFVQHYAQTQKWSNRTEMSLPLGDMLDMYKFFTLGVFNLNWNEL